ncbi:MAG: hypothetical protein M0Z64_08980 [Nitrospiraceae bacterium]|nr:hypothetical protein [Nitrospiraceae bacterium]
MERKIIWFFIVIGTFCLIMGISFTVFELPYHEIISTLCFAAAVTFYTATIIERMLLVEFTHQASDKVEELFRKYNEEAQNTIRQQLNTRFDLLKKAEYNGLIGILPPRRDRYKDPITNKQQNEITDSRIKSSLIKTKNVKIFCISGREFLSQTTEGKFYDVFLQKAKDNEEFNVKVMLAEPQGYGAVVRCAIENPDDPLCVQRDVENVLRGKSSLAKSWQREGSIRENNRESQPRWFITVKFYNFIPQAWFVITDEEMFIEPYHMAGNGFKLKFPSNFTDNDPAVGGRVPIFVFNRGSFFYEAMNDYFDWLWKHDDQNVFNQRFQESFNVVDET